MLFVLLLILIQSEIFEYSVLHIVGPVKIESEILKYEKRQNRAFFVLLWEDCDLTSLSQSSSLLCESVCMWAHMFVCVSSLELGVCLCKFLNVHI